MDRIDKTLLRDRVISLFEESGSKHWILTGSIGIGKTTMIREICSLLPSYSGIQTKLEIPANPDQNRSIVLSEMGAEEFYRVAVWNGQRMVEMDCFFDRIGTQLLEKHMESDAEFFVFDEIGAVEQKSAAFLEALNRLFDRKRVFAVKKKSASALNQILSCRDDYCLVDLDDFYLDIPYELLRKKRADGTL